MLIGLKKCLANEDLSELEKQVIETQIKKLGKEIRINYKLNKDATFRC